MMRVPFVVVSDHFLIGSYHYGPGCEQKWLIYEGNYTHKHIIMGMSQKPDDMSAEAIKYKLKQIYCSNCYMT